MNRPLIAELQQVGLQYGRLQALRNISLGLLEGQLTGLIGPDGVGKSSLMSLLAGARRIQTGSVRLFGGDMASARHRQRICSRIAYMPQGLGGNLYPSLTVLENLDFLARLFDQQAKERRGRINLLLSATGLSDFRDRPVAQLSGGMKQKLGLCCALIHDPDLLLLDEPTTGVDPLSRHQFWQLIADIRRCRPAMTVLVATAYMEEASGFDWLVAMDRGQVLATGTPAGLMSQTGSRDLETTFARLLPQQQNHAALVMPRYQPVRGQSSPMIQARGLSRRFDGFTAVDQVSFDIRRGEIFGFLGSNGCGKTTTMKMLTGLLPASAGEVLLFGRPIRAGDMQTRQRIGYMSQGFSLYGELSVRQNLLLHAQLFHIPPGERSRRVGDMLDQFDLRAQQNYLPGQLPLGVRQRLSLAVAVIHRPEILILDEPTSGVDPLARERFWAYLMTLSRRDGVTIFISTHFMNEALRCDRVSLMHAGRVLECDEPARLIQRHGQGSLEAAFIDLLQQAQQDSGEGQSVSGAYIPSTPVNRDNRGFSLRRMLAYTRRELTELARDPVRATLTLLGTTFLLMIMGYGINLDVEQLDYAVLDYDRTTNSRAYALNLAGSRYFREQRPIQDDDDRMLRMQAGKLAMAVEIPPGFGRDLKHGRIPEVSFWIDGAMPVRADTIRGYAEGIHNHYLQQLAREQNDVAVASAPVQVATRFRYNPDIRSLPAMMPAIIPILLMMVPAMLTALGVVREKELGTITNFHVTPVTRLEFLLGKQAPYVILSMANFAILLLVAVFFFGVPVKGSLLTLSLGALLYVICTTGLGLLLSALLRSQIAAIFGTAIATLVPAIQFSGLTYPVSSMQGMAAFVGHVYPTAHFITISRGVFSKSLGMAELAPYLLALLVTIPLLTLACVGSLRKQEK